MALTGHVLELHRPREGEVIGIVDLHARLAKLLVIFDELEVERAVRQLAEAAAEVAVDRARVDSRLTRLDQLLNFTKVAIQEHANPAMVEHLLKHRCEAAPGHDLKTMLHVTLVAVQPHWNATTDANVQIARMHLPLLQRVIDVEGFIEFAADPT